MLSSHQKQFFSKSLIYNTLFRSQYSLDFLILFTCLLLVFLYLFKKRAPYIDYIPQPHFDFFWGHLNLINQNLPKLRDQLVELCEQYGEKYGAVALCTPGRPPRIMLCDPKNIEYVMETKFEDYVKRWPIGKPHSSDELGEILGHGIFASDGVEQRRQRKLYSYMFSGKLLREHMFKEFKILGDKIVKKIDNFIDKNEFFDIQNLFCRLTIEGICNIAFGQKFDVINPEKTPDYVLAFDRLQILCVDRSRELFQKAKRWLNIGSESEIKKQTKILHNFVESMIRKIRYDLINKDRNEYETFNIVKLAIERSNNTISDEELKDIVLSFLIAGRDTTACAMTQIIYELCNNPNICKKCIKEINQFSETELNYSNISKNLKYLQAVFMESLRLHPSVPMDSKIATKHDVLPSGLKIKPGQMLSFHPYIAGRNRRVQGDDVFDFKPERFLDLNGNERKYSDSVYPQFNIGLRLCLGKKMAILESKYILSRLLQKFNFILDENKFPITYAISLIHQVKGGLQVKATRR